MNEQEKISRERANIFRDMAQAIELNEASSFGGAVVIIPPKGGTPIEMLVLDSREDGMQFYTSIKTMVEVAYNELLRDEQSKRAFGGIR